MQLSLAQMIALKEQGLTISSDLLVMAYQEENGFAPIGIIAKICGLSLRSVERSLTLLKGVELPSAKMSHDHDHGDHVIKGTPPELPKEPARDADPLRDQLLAFEVWEGCVDILMAKVDRTAIETQLVYHAFRVAQGFRFKAHPAKYLFRACMGNYAPPEGFHAQTERVRSGVPKETRTVEFVRPVVVEKVVSREETIENIRKVWKSSGVAFAQKIARRNGIEWEDVIAS